jgi:hypothetical protein
MGGFILDAAGYFFATLTENTSRFIDGPKGYTTLNRKFTSTTKFKFNWSALLFVDQ